MSSLEMVDYINAMRQPGEAELRHDHFMAKVPKVLGEGTTPKLSGVDHFIAGNGAMRTRDIYNFPKREACLMAMSYSYDLQAKVYDRMTALEAGMVAQPTVIKAPSNLREALRLPQEGAAGSRCG